VLAALWLDHPVDHSDDLNGGEPLVGWQQWREVPQTEHVIVIGTIKGRPGSAVDLRTGWPGDDLGGRGVGLIV
jgi:hypothetical protein